MFQKLIIRNYSTSANSPWKHKELVEQIQSDITELIGDEEEGCIIVDESGFPKQGKNSVGVKRQYCGNLGKVDNCQVGVYLSYTKGVQQSF